VNFKNFFKQLYNWYLVLLTFLVSLPILAPMLLHFGLTGHAKIIYFIYSFFCHQFSTRSIGVFEYQYAWCARDTGIWIGIWVIALLVKLNKIKGIKWYWLIPFVIPIALDGGLQTIFTVFNIGPSGVLLGDPLYVSNNLVRFITGSVFGVGLSLYLSPLIKDELKAEKTQDQKNLFKIIIVILGLVPVYLGMIFIWNSTSSINTPTDFADSAVKIPVDDFFVRRADAICPSDGVEEFFTFDCFFGSED
jgi:uncharacterized membrane protein